MVKMEKFCFCAPLKWGMLIIAIFDTILNVLGCVALGFEEHKDQLYMLTPLVYGVLTHLIACILLVVSIKEQKREHVICYIITGSFRLVYAIYLIVCGFIYWFLFVAIIHLVLLIFGIYFLVCVFF
ncbi:uncharacterized protein LOC117781108 [Drosophila innubila]|uniref:uncharacterized protein LOC117781108 n=1 Tax=Drosophila innubila TaxID=198719 RepID=UPI00148D9C3D|nr:uncharacterized protein LOC117781108 [Drosophila innubila]